MGIRLHYIYTRYPHWGEYAGTNQLLKHISTEQYQVAVQVEPDSDEDFPIRNRAVRGYLRYIIQQRGMQWYKLSDLTAEVRAFQQCLLNRVDLVHYLDGEHSAQYLPMMLRRVRLKRVKLLGTFHQPVQLLPPLVIKDVISQLDCITVVSPDQVPFFASFLPTDRIQVILYGVDTDYFKPGVKSYDKKKFKCITVGHYLRDFKALRETVIKMQSQRGIEFCVVTSKETGMEGLPNVTIHKNVTDARLLALYQGADILFLPLLDATANNSILEGIACGLPVVTTFLPSVKSYLPGQEAILVENNNIDTFMAEIIHLQQNPDKSAFMSYYARCRAEELSWKKITLQYESLYLKLINNN